MHKSYGRRWWVVGFALLLGCAHAPKARTDASTSPNDPSSATAASDGEIVSSARAREEMTPPPSIDGSADANRDPAVTDGDKYSVVLENDRVRVLRYHDVPGAKTHLHYHPDSVLHAMSAFKRRLIFADGTIKEREFQPGDVMYLPPQSHIGENIGTTNTEVLLVELKRP